MRAPQPGACVPSHFGELLERAAERWPDTEALVFPARQVGDARWTYAALATRARKCRNHLCGQGVRAGDHVALVLHNGPDFIAWLGGITQAGAVAVPLNTRYRPAELAYALADSAAVAVVTANAPGDEPGPAERVGAAVDDGRATSAQLRKLVMIRADRAVVRGPSSGARGADTLPSLDRPRDSDIALLMYTSGTTAEPKGCLLRHTTWLRAARAMSEERYRLRPGDRIWNPLPMFHMAALHPFAACATAGATFVGMTRFDADEALRQIADERISVLYAAFPTILADLVHAPGFRSTDFSRVRRINCVGAPDMLRMLQGEFPNATLTSVYGLTEAGGVVAYGIPEEPLDVRVGTAGRPFDGIDVRIADPDGRPLPSGEIGELQLRGWCVFAGYWDRDAATRDAIADDGWLRTGDLGALDADGRIVFHGRLKDVLKVGGENVSAVEVESVLARHPAVKLAQVVGRADARLGEVPVAFVELRADATTSDVDLMDHCRALLASFKVPRQVRFVTQWPMSATKIQKHRLRAMLTMGP